ncbi:MAG: SCP2 sterol-binding domain-containing protein [Desulfobacterales bacterium]|nr:SCP2 sterol-binding domain-containing protein [Desulfobacterales bacterium]
MEFNLENALTLLRKLPYYPVLQSKSKYALIDTTLSVIAAAFEEVSALAPELKEEIAHWNEGRRFAIGVLPRGPYITMEKKGDRIRFVGKGQKKPDVTFIFKNLDSALLVFTAQISAHQAAAECRVLIDGNNAYAMELNRALAMVETYLFPAFIFKIIFKRPPKLSSSQLIIKSKVYANLLPILIKHYSQVQIAKFKD